MRLCPGGGRPSPGSAKVRAATAGGIELPEFSERRGCLRGRLDQTKADLLVATNRLQQTIAGSGGTW